MVFFIGYSTRYPFGEVVLKRQYGERWNCCRFNKQNNSFVHALSGAFLYPPFKVTAWNFLMWRVPVDEKITTTNIIFFFLNLSAVPTFGILSGLERTRQRWKKMEIFSAITVFDAKAPFCPDPTQVIYMCCRTNKIRV